MQKDTTIDLSYAVKVEAILVSNSVVVIGQKQLVIDDTYCDQSNWPYLKNEKLQVTFEKAAHTHNLRVTVQRLLPNPNYKECTDDCN